MAKDSEITINVTANTEGAERPLEALVEVMKANEAAVKSNDEALAAAAAEQERVQAVARQLIEAVREIGDPTLKQQVENLFAGGISSAANMVKRVQELQRENRVLEKIQDSIITKLNEQQIPSGGGVEEQAAGALHALRGMEGRFSALTRGRQGVAANIAGVADAEAMAELLQMLMRVNEELREAHMNAAAGEEAARGQAEALREEAYALEEGLPGRAQKEAALMAEAAAYDRIAASQKQVMLDAAARLEQVERVVKLAGDGKLDEARGVLKGETRRASVLTGRGQAVDSAQQQHELKKAADAEKAAEKAAAERVKAAEKEAAALKKVADAEALATAEMKFSALNKQQLARAVDELTRKRQEAAKAGDVAQYNRLTRELQAAARQMEHTNRSLQMNQIAGAQQVQMAQQVVHGVAQMGSEFLNLGKSIDEGSLSIEGMSSAAIGLGIAIKTGLGPVGWAMLALEALVAAWNFFAQKRKADEERMRQEAAEMAKLQAEQRNKMEELWQKQAERSAESFAELWTRQTEYLTREKEERERLLADGRAVEQEEHRHRLAMLELEYQAARGKDKERIEERMRQEREAEAQAKLEHERQNADVAERFADDLEGSLERRKAQMGELMTGWLPDIEAVEERAQRLMADARQVVRLSEDERLGLEAEQRRAREQMLHILRLVREVDADFKGTAEDAVRWAAKMRETHREQEKVAEATRAQVVAMRRGVALSERATANKEEELARDAELKEAQEAQVRAERRLAELLGKRVSQQYSPKERRTQDEVFEADRVLLGKKLAAVDAEIARQRAEGATSRDLLPLRRQRRDIARQLVGLEEAQLEATRRGIEEMRRFEAQDMTGPTRRRDEKADRLSEDYARIAVKAQAALDKGLDGRARKLMRKMDRLAVQIDRQTGDEQGSDMNRRVQGALRLQLDAENRTTRAKRRKAQQAEAEVRGAQVGATQAQREGAQESAELRAAVKALEGQNAQLTGFLRTASGLMRQVVQLCTAMRGELGHANGELGALSGRVKTLEAGLKNMARK